MRHALNIPNYAPFDDPRLVADVARDAEAGATWYQESLGPWRGDIAALRKRVEHGPVTAG